MSNPEKTSTSADKEEDEEESRTNTDQAVTTTTTTTTTVVTPPTRRRRTVQVRPASGESKRSKSSAVKGAGSSSSAKTGKQKRKSGELDAPKGEPRCPLCGSRFGSWKGYFGHLRVHPERDWSGAFPPPTFDPGEEMADEQFQDYMASELTRIGHDTLRKMRHEESSTGASNTRARNVGIDLNIAPEVDDHQTAEFDLNLPPRRNIDSDDDDGKKEDDDDDAPAF